MWVLTACTFFVQKIRPMRIKIKTNNSHEIRLHFFKNLWITLFLLYWNLVTIPNILWEALSKNFCWHMLLRKPFCYHVVKPKLPKEIVIKLNLTKLINFLSKEKWFDFHYHTIWQEKTWFGKKNKLFPACIANSYWHQQKSARYLSNFLLFK